MAKLTVFNPVARPVESRDPPARRVSDLAGKRIGLFWNMKPRGDQALQRVEELLQQRYAGTEFRRYQGTVGWAMRHLTTAQASQIAREVDVVVGTTSD